MTQLKIFYIYKYIIQEKEDYRKLYGIIISPVVLYGFETWPRTFSYETRFCVFENRLLRKLFGTKCEDITGG
jgi:hypothetical protein